MNAIDQGSSEVTTPRSLAPRFLKVIAVAVVGIALLSWPFVQHRKDGINSWIEKRRGSIGIVCLWSIAIAGKVVRKLTERAEEIHELQEAGFSDWPRGVRSSGRMMPD